MYPGAYLDRFADKPAALLAGTDHVLTFGELELRSRQLARALHRRGLRRGDGLALVSDNDVTVFEVYWAAMRSGLYLTVVNHHLSPQEVAYIVDDCDAHALLVSAAKAELAVAVTPLTPIVDTRLAFGGDVPGYESYDAAIAAEPTDPLTEQPRGSIMLYSSGTTGRPKGIKPPLPDGQLGHQPDAFAVLCAALWAVDDATVYLSPAPLYHAAPLRFCAAIQALGGTVVVMERFDAEDALRCIDAYRVTHSQWVPTMFVRMLKLPENVRDAYDMSSMKVAVHAAAPCPVEIKTRMIDWWGPILHEYYSSTEANGITNIDSAESQRKPGSVGKALVGVARICDEDGVELPPGTIGNVYFERDETPFVYHNDPAKTAASQHPAHPTWTTTGDVGYLDEDGYLFLTDRKSFVIISGGVNIYPQEIEGALAAHPAVLDVAVFGVPDDEMGQSVRAVVEATADATPGPELEQELKDYLRARIARFKVPRTIEFTLALPRTPTGKLAKATLVQQFSADLAEATKG